MVAEMPANPPIEVINQRLTERAQQRAIADGVPEDKLLAYESANPTWMSGYGLQRYWRKYRQKSDLNQVN
jgi:hypothetical protein